MNASGGFPAGYPAPPGAGSSGQLAVDPSRRGTGLGRALLTLAEDRLTALGGDTVVIDTSSAARDLLAWYARRGYRAVGSWTWRVTNDESTVLRRSLTGPGPGEEPAGS